MAGSTARRRLQSWPGWLAACALITGVLACGPSAGTAESSSQRATGLAQTALYMLTSTAFASVTPATPTPPPSATAGATASTTPRPAPATATLPPPTVSPTLCVNHSEFVRDVNVPDGTHFAPDTAFVKSWQLRNDGGCTWTPDYRLRLIGGDALGGTSIPLPHAVPPGALLDISVTLTAPGSSGTYTSVWQLYSPEGMGFGARPFVKIMVP
jgi:hypothetical protein